MGFSLKNYINFDFMITPVVMKILCLVETVLILLGGFIGLILLFTIHVGAGIAGIFLVPIVVAFLIILNRIGNEVLVVLFQIHKNTTKISQNSEK